MDYLAGAIVVGAVAAMALYGLADTLITRYLRRRAERRFVARVRRLTR